MNLLVMKLIQHQIKTKPQPFTFETKLKDITSLVESQTYSHFPVSDEGVYMGSIAAEDIIPSETKTVGDYRYSLLPYCSKRCGLV